MKERDGDNCLNNSCTLGQVAEMDQMDVEDGRSAFNGREQVVKNVLEHYLSEIAEWEYCYCVSCKKIVFSKDLEATGDGIRCSKCKGNKLEAPGWVNCPHHKNSVVKCPRSGKGIVKLKYGYECQDHCYFRAN